MEFSAAFVPSGPGSRRQTGLEKDARQILLSVLRERRTAWVSPGTQAVSMGQTRGRSGRGARSPIPQTDIPNRAEMGSYAASEPTDSRDQSHLDPFWRREARVKDIIQISPKPLGMSNAPLQGQAIPVPSPSRTVTKDLRTISRSSQRSLIRSTPMDAPVVSPSRRIVVMRPQQGARGAAGRWGVEQAQLDTGPTVPQTSVREDEEEDAEAEDRASGSSSEEECDSDEQAGSRREEGPEDSDTVSNPSTAQDGEEQLEGIGEDLLVSDGEDAHDAEWAVGEEWLDDEDETTEKESGSECTETDWCSEAEQDNLNRVLEEAESADLVGRRGGLWHSAFYGIAPTVVFPHSWYMELMDQDIAKALANAKGKEEEEEEEEEEEGAAGRGEQAAQDSAGRGGGGEGGERGHGEAGEGEEASRGGGGDRVGVLQRSSTLGAAGKSLGVGLERVYNAGVLSRAQSWTMGVTAVASGKGGGKEKGGKVKRAQRVLRLKMTNKSSQVRRAHEAAGFKVFRADQDKALRRSQNWNCWWAHPLSPNDKAWGRMVEFQKINHFPGTFVIGRKDRLTNTLSRFKRRVGKAEVQFYPRTHILPAEYNEFKEAFKESHGLWIWKPPASARGVGIKIVTKLSQVSKSKPGLVQAYLAHPYLINGFKFDIRVYVVATSFNPLKLYIFHNGLVRFSTKPYKKVKRNSSNRSRYMHLTNYSVNKKSNNFKPRTDADLDAFTGSKWSLFALWRYLRERDGLPQEQVAAVWNGIKEVVLKTFIAAESHINVQTSLLNLASGNCFEIWGVDILLDRSLKPWLIEVNTCPDMSASSPMDRAIKGALFTDTFTLAGIELCNRKARMAQVMQRLAHGSANARTGAASATKCRLRRQAPGSSAAAADDEWRNLSPAERAMLQQCEDEFRRQEETGFERLFPHRHYGEAFARLFECQRPANALLHKWVLRRTLQPSPGLQSALDMKPSAVLPSREFDPGEGAAVSSSSAGPAPQPTPPRPLRTQSLKAMPGGATDSTPMPRLGRSFSSFSTKLPTR